MYLRKRMKDSKGMTTTVLIVLIVILMVSASSVVVLLYTGQQSNQVAITGVVEKGDTVKVNYIGRLEDGRVFDTSLWDVASNDALYPKSLSFSLRAQSSYTPLTFTVGSGQMIAGFDQGVIGMSENETKVIVVPIARLAKHRICPYCNHGYAPHGSVRFPSQIPPLPTA